MSSPSRNLTTRNFPVFDSVWSVLRRICYTAEERVPVIDQPYIWLFMCNHLHSTDCIPLLNSLSSGVSSIDNNQILQLFSNVNYLRSALKKNPRKTVELTKKLQVSGLHYTSIIESIWGVASDRVTDNTLINGVSEDSSERGDYCEYWLQLQLGIELYDDLLYSNINHFDQHELIEPLDGEELRLVSEAIPKALMVIERLKKLEAIRVRFNGKEVSF